MHVEYACLKIGLQYFITHYVIWYEWCNNAIDLLNA